MRKARIVAIAGALVAALSLDVGAQDTPPPVGNPPVLSTSPTPPAGAIADASQMSGLPLQVGDLPPGVVAVRVIRRSFAENVPGQEVELHVGGRVLKVMTNKEGRAQFDGLQVGDTVHARAVVDAEPLASQRFQLPAQGGVRLILVAGVGAAVPPDSAPILSAGVDAPATPAPGAPQTPAEPGNRLVLPLVLAFASVGGGFVWFTRRPRASRGATHVAAVLSSGPSRPALVTQRTVVFERLIRLEEEQAAGRAGAQYSTTREKLIDELVSLDSDLDEPVS